MKVDFATFCYKGDAHRLHAPGQLKKQVESNNFEFDWVHIFYQGINFQDYNPHGAYSKVSASSIMNIDRELGGFGIDFWSPQYVSPIDKTHTWKNHVVNHIVAIQNTNADYIVFADNDCWMVRQPENKSWVEYGIELLQSNRDIFIVSPNDGEPERKTLRMSQQMFLVKVNEFRNANFNQPGYTGNPNNYDTMPEYHAMLEGRMEYHCRESGQFRYVLGPEFRYFHHNRLDENGHFDTDYEKLGWM